MNKELLTNIKHTYETPDDFFKRLDDEFHFTLDAAASPENAKCSLFFTEEDNGVLRDWHSCSSSEIVWCNPPYGKQQIDFVKKGFHESFYGVTSVFLIPTRPDTKLWAQTIFKSANEIRFVTGRLKFKGCKDPAPFPSAVVIFRPQVYGHTYKFINDSIVTFYHPYITTMDAK